MVRPIKVKPPKKAIPKEKQGVSPLLWYGGKQTTADWIVGHIPPHQTYVELFMGGGSVIFRKLPSKLDIGNDIGNSVVFFRVLREWGDELYDKLYYTPYSREEFYNCRESWKNFSDEKIRRTAKEGWKASDLDRHEAIEWARCWYVVLTMGYAHEESPTSPWKPSKTNDLAFSWNNRVEELPRFIERLRTVVLEDIDYKKAIELYDSKDTFFYCDPPYTPGSRVSKGNYVHEMPQAEHVRFLQLMKKIKGQFAISMYDDELYNKELSDFRVDSLTHVSGVQNSKSIVGRANRTEKLWLKEHNYGLWTPFPTLEETSPDVSREEDELE